LVFALEAANTAVEHITDLISPDFHSLAGRAKDMAAAAVLLGSLGSLAAGLFILAPKLAAFL
jgi:diacylglycerol kinase (ATP)